MNIPGSSIISDCLLLLLILTETTTLVLVYKKCQVLITVDCGLVVCLCTQLTLGGYVNMWVWLLFHVVIDTWWEH